jgi:MFS family permease
MAASAPRPRLFSYENGLLLMMCLCNGVVALDRSTTNFLAKPIQDEFHLSNAQIGLLASALSIVIAPSGFLIAALADSTRKRKLILLIALTAFSIFSALPAILYAYPLLLGSRLLLGAAEGPILPVAQSVMAMESSPARRGFNMGILQNLGAAGLGVMLGPIIFSQLAAHFGWRAAFLASGVPGLLLALAIVAWMRPVKEPARQPTPGAEGGLGEVLGNRNILICIAIAGLFSAWLLVQGVFLTLYLQTKDGLSLTQAGLLISVTGVAQLIAGTVVPALSDRIGRKPALFVMTLIGVLAPVLTLAVPGSSPFLGLALFVGWLGGGAGPLYISIIPTESVPPRHAATAVAIALASGEIIGGVIGPAAAGHAADLFGLAAPFWITAGAAGLCALLTLFLKETAPSRARSG